MSAAFTMSPIWVGLALSTVDPRMRWIASYCQPLRLNRTYYCRPADAG